MIDYLKYGGTACLALGGALQYFRSWGIGDRWSTLIGGMFAIGVYVVAASANYHGDWRLLLFEGFAIVPGFAGAIVGGIKGTDAIGQAIVARGETSEDRAKLAASPAVPVVPPKEAP